MSRVFKDIHPRVLIVAEHASAAFGGEAILPLQYFRRLHRRGVPVWMLVHERTRSELLRVCEGAAERLFFVEDRPVHRALWRLGKRLPRRLEHMTTGLGIRLVNQFEMVRRARELISNLGIDVIHQPIPVSPKDPSMLFGLGVPVVMGPMNGGMSFPSAFADMEPRSL